MKAWVGEVDGNWERSDTYLVRLCIWGVCCSGCSHKPGGQPSDSCIRRWNAAARGGPEVGVHRCDRDMEEGIVQMLTDVDAKCEPGCGSQVDGLNCWAALVQHRVL